MDNKSHRKKDSVSWLIIKVPNLSNLDNDKSHDSSKSLKSDKGNINDPLCVKADFDKITKLKQKLFLETKHSKSFYK